MQIPKSELRTPKPQSVVSIQEVNKIFNSGGRERVIASTDCGFSQHWNLIRVHETVQWAKLRALAEGAALATQELWR